VVNYILSKLEDDGIMLQSWPVYFSPEQAQQEPAPDSTAGPALELVCNGMVRVLNMLSASTRRLLRAPLSSDALHAGRLYHMTSASPQSMTSYGGARSSPKTGSSVYCTEYVILLILLQCRLSNPSCNAVRPRDIKACLLGRAINFVTFDIANGHNGYQSVWSAEHASGVC